MGIESSLPSCYSCLNATNKIPCNSIADNALKKQIPPDRVFLLKMYLTLGMHLCGDHLLSIACIREKAEQWTYSITSLTPTG